ncbi:MAG: hypothetical protein M0R80_28535 [Proteobacteria bacterium]|jgi:hypothetical protein|nr:hypothetical protein [Pseudomonadota bacterium]
MTESNELPAPTCGDCKAFYKEAKDETGSVRGLCMKRPELGELPASLPYCHVFTVRDSRVGKVRPVDKGKPDPRRARRGGEDPVDREERRRATLGAPVEGDTGGEITMDRDGLKQVLRELLEEETLYGYPEMGSRWQGGALVIKPENPENQPKEIPIETFFHKIVMLRDRLRVLEAKVNGHEKLSEADKVELQGYITKCYGSLTTFNVLFKNRDDQFTSKGE